MVLRRFILHVAVLSVGVAGGCQDYLADAAIEHYVQGKLAMDGRRYRAALAELAEAVELDPDLSLAHAAIGDIHRKRGNYRLAVGAYERACDTNPYAFRPHYNLGVTYQRLGDQAETAKAIEDYLRKAVQVYLRAVSLRPRDFDTNVNLSSCYYEQGKYDLAEKYSKACTQIDPKNPYGFSNLAIVFDALNRPYDAIRAYKQSLELDVHQPKLLMNLGSTYLRLGRMKEALHASELAAKEDPNSPYPWVQVGACHFRMKDLSQALTTYQKAADIDGNCAGAFRGMGVVFMTRFVMDPKKLDCRDKGLSAWNRSLELDSKQPDLVRLVRKYTPKTAPPRL